MKMLSDEETKLWCRVNEITLTERGVPDRSDPVLTFDIPCDAQKRVALVTRAMRSFSVEPVFLVLFDNWGIWPSGQRMHIFDRIRLSYGETRSLKQSPGQLFDQAEIEDAVSFVTIGILFLWDCYVVTANRTKMLFLSHDEHGLAKGLKFELEGASSESQRRLQ